MRDSEALAAVTEVLRTLASGNTSVAECISIPGPDTAVKRDLEKELLAVASKLGELESRANTPPSNGELEIEETNGTQPSPLSLPESHPPREASPVPTFALSPLLIPAKSGEEVQLDKNQIILLHDHVKAQELALLKSKQEVATLQDELRKAHEQSKAANKTTQVITLQRELKKSQQANEAFSKSLREIGEIVTAGSYTLPFGFHELHV